MPFSLLLPERLMSQEHSDPALLDPLRRLASMKPGDCVPLPPRRLAMDAGYECLIEWRPLHHPDEWRLDLTRRPISVDDKESPVQQFGAAISLGGRAPAISWDGHEEAFDNWVKQALPGIVAETQNMQAAERGKVETRAQISRSKASIRDFVPHIVILIALAAFAYMFAVVHIKF